MQFAPLALMAGGQLIQGIGAARAGKYNRKVARVNARNSLIEGNADATRIQDLARIQLGRQIGAQAESGFEVGTGSALDTLIESQTNAELDAMDARRQARSRAAAYKSQGDLAYAEGRNHLIGSVFGAAASVAGGLNDYAQASGGAGGGGGGS